MNRGRAFRKMDPMLAVRQHEIDKIKRAKREAILAKAEHEKAKARAGILALETKFVEVKDASEEEKES